MEAFDDASDAFRQGLEASRSEVAGSRKTLARVSGESPSEKAVAALKEIVESIPTHNATLERHHVLELATGLTSAIVTHSRIVVASFSPTSKMEDVVLTLLMQTLMPQYLGLLGRVVELCAHDDSILRVMRDMKACQTCADQDRLSALVKGALHKFVVGDDESADATVKVLHTIKLADDGPTWTQANLVWKDVVNSKALLNWGSVDTTSTLALMRMLVNWLPKAFAV